MKKFIATGIALVAVFFGGMAVRAAVDGPGIVGPPLIDRANAGIKLSGNLKSTTCAGVSAVKYITYTGSWKGTETQILPDPTPRPLSGTLTVSGIAWTINLSTGRGVLTGAIGLSSAAAGPSTRAGSPSSRKVSRQRVHWSQRVVGSPPTSSQRRALARSWPTSNSGSAPPPRPGSSVTPRARLASRTSRWSRTTTSADVADRSD
jgi:hypothetical protein